MSGGYFDYKQWEALELADDLETVKEITKYDEFEDTVFFKAICQEAADHIRRGATIANRIDWLLSGDDGEESFKERLEEDLQENER